MGRARARGRRGGAAWVAWAAAAAAALALLGSADAQRDIIVDLSKSKKRQEFQCTNQYTPDEAGKPLIDIPGVTWMSMVQAIEMEGNTKPFIFFRVSWRPGTSQPSIKLINNLSKPLTLRELRLFQEATPFHWVNVDGSHCANTDDFEKYMEAIPKEDTAKLARAQSVAKMAKFGRGKNYYPKVLITDKDLNIQRKLSAVTVDPYADSKFSDSDPKHPYWHRSGVTVRPLLQTAVSKFKLDHWDGEYKHKKDPEEEEEEEEVVGAGGAAGVEL